MPILEVHIANNGIILLRYARVISITGNDIRVAMSLDTVDFTWLIQTSAYRGTTFLKSRNEKAELADIQVDDLITVNGKLVSSGAEPIIDAQIVRL